MTKREQLREEYDADWSLERKGGIDGGCEWCVIGSGNEAGKSGRG